MNNVMKLNRREFVSKFGMAAVGGVLLAGCDLSERTENGVERRTAPSSTKNKWNDVRNQFELSHDYIHLSALYISSHPKSVREAIEEYRRNLNSDPVLFLNQENRRRRRLVKQAAAEYLSVSADEIALTDSTTMGLGLVYNGLNFHPGDEIITSEHDYFVTHESLRTASLRNGTIITKVQLFNDLQNFSSDEIVHNIKNAITGRTRLIALTWVHSNTGFKLPVKEISAELKEINASRSEDDKILFSVDGVHGFGVEDVTMSEMGCDFFIAGCHKWLFGPRGTGIVWGRKDAWEKVTPTIPSFTDDELWAAWLNDEDPDGETTASRITPGGFKAFEHQWAMAEAFEFHKQIGKKNIAERTHYLADTVKEALNQMNHVELHTPRGNQFSSGIITFDVKGASPDSVVKSLRGKNIIATATPYSIRHARVTPSIINNDEEINIFIREMENLA
jgi:isopenicillin-N epimerase